MAYWEGFSACFMKEWTFLNALLLEYQVNSFCDAGSGIDESSSNGGMSKTKAASF
jgi:hypothetical protein